MNSAFIRSMLYAVSCMVLSAVLTAADRITLEDGTAIECTVKEQTADSVVYEKDGAVFTLRKAEIRSLVLDIDSDKYYIAALSADTPEKRIAYLLRSIQNFPDKDENKIALAKAYIALGDLTKAEEIVRGRTQPAYRILAALIMLKQGDRTGARSILSAVDCAALDRDQELYHSIVTAAVLFELGDTESAIAVFQQAKETDKAGLAERFAVLFPDESAKQFQARMFAARDRKEAEKAARSAMPMRSISSIDLGLRIPLAFSAAFTQFGTFTGASFGGGVSAGVTLFENMLPDARISLELSLAFIDNEAALPKDYFAAGSFLRQFDIRIGVAGLFHVSALFAGIGCSWANVFAGTYGNPSFSAPLAASMLGSDLHVSIIAGYTAAISDTVSIPLAAKIDWIIPVPLNAAPFEFGVYSGITVKIPL